MDTVTAEDPSDRLRRLVKSAVPYTILAITKKDGVYTVHVELPLTKLSGSLNFNPIDVINASDVTLMRALRSQIAPLAEIDSSLSTSQATDAAAIRGAVQSAANPTRVFDAEFKEL
jgi:hypothetical protein